MSQDSAMINEYNRGVVFQGVPMISGILNEVQLFIKLWTKYGTAAIAGSMDMEQ